MKIDLKIEIKRNSDNKISVEIWSDWDYNEYWFSEGNASCDCNREIFFCNALGIEEDENIICGNDKYVIRLSNNMTEEVLYNEFLIE